MCQIHIGGEQHEYLAISILNRAAIDSPVLDYWENNWLTALVEVRAGACRADIRCEFLTEDFDRLREGLRELYAQKSDSLDFQTLEGWLTFHLFLEKNGEILLVGDLIDRPMDGNRLRFRLSFDLSYLPQILTDLDRVVESYPVVGKCEPPLAEDSLPPRV